MQRSPFVGVRMVSFADEPGTRTFDDTTLPLDELVSNCSIQDEDSPQRTQRAQSGEGGRLQDSYCHMLGPCAQHNAAQGERTPDSVFKAQRELG